MWMSLRLVALSRRTFGSVCTSTLALRCGIVETISFSHAFRTIDFGQTTSTWRTAPMLNR